MRNIREITNTNDLLNILKEYISKNKFSDEYLISFDCPPELLSLLVNDGNVLIRKIGVQNKNCSVQTLERIIKFDTNSTIKKVAIQNPNCTPELLDRLLMDSDYFIREAAKKRMENLQVEIKTDFKKSKNEEELDNMILYYNELKEIEHQREKQNKPKIMADPAEIAMARRMAVTNVGRLDTNNEAMEQISSEMPQVTIDNNLPNGIVSPTATPQNIPFPLGQESEEEQAFEAAIERELAEEEQNKSPSKLLLTIDKLKRSNKLFVRKFYHSIRVDSDTFLSKVDDHYEIKDEFLTVLNFLNLENIDTTNLKVSGVNISESNLKIDPQTVYNKDLSNATLDDKNLVSYNFDGVNMEGTNVGVKRYD